MSIRLINTSRALQRSFSATTKPTCRNFHSSPIRKELYANADVNTFKKTTSVNDRITIVDFYADWCGPCRQLSPTLEKLTKEPSKSGSSGLPLDLVKLDIETNEGSIVASQFKVRSLPTVVAFRNGAPIAQFIGALPEPGVKSFIEKL